MAKIFDKATDAGPDRTLILNTREGIIYPFPFDDWNILRVGAFISIANSSNDNQDIMVGGTRTEDVPIINIQDKLLQGVIRNNGGNFPNENNTPFLGWHSGSETSISGGSTQCNISASAFPGSIGFGNNFNGLHLCTGTIHANGVVVRSTSASPSQMGIGNPPANSIGGTNNFCWFFGMILQPINKGQSNQTMSLKSAFAVNSYTNTNDANLQSAMLTTSHTDYGTTEWAISGVPYNMPNALYLYWPFTTFRMRIHNLGVIKQS